MRISKEIRASIVRKVAANFAADIAAADAAVAAAKAAAEKIRDDLEAVASNIAERAVAEFAAAAKKMKVAFDIGLADPGDEPNIRVGYSSLPRFVEAADRESAPAVTAAKNLRDRLRDAARDAAEDAIAEVELAGRRSDVDRIISEVVKAAKEKLDAKEAR